MKTPNQKTGFAKRIGSIDSKNTQYGGTILGFILGLGAGLGIAFVIAFYLSKNAPQERPGMRAPSLPLTIKPAPAPAVPLRLRLRPPADLRPLHSLRAGRTDQGARFLAGRTAQHPHHPSC